ncbi:MAG: 30S ribosomal protein S5 [Patescibacteria group bacterium]|jgi:small subunit ribosomal protein S5
MMQQRSNRRNAPESKVEPEFKQQLIELARVTRVVQGGKRMSFRACIAIGNCKGDVGVGVAKGADVSLAMTKATREANKNLIKIPITDDTIPHWVKVKEGSAVILLRPAEKGHGIVAGGVSRVILALTGIKNITAKTLGSRNKINNARATIKALQALRYDRI